MKSKDFFAKILPIIIFGVIAVIFIIFQLNRSQDEDKKNLEKQHEAGLRMINDVKSGLLEMNTFFDAIAAADKVSSQQVAKVISEYADKYNSFKDLLERLEKNTKNAAQYIKDENTDATWFLMQTTLLQPEIKNYNMRELAFYFTVGKYLTNKVPEVVEAFNKIKKTK